ncbi:hypothetical protein OG21DRAFT_813597 [Imleria badia]|nr:hypothetical protein OG21DRAFT_813597 [Imleria badia]
MPERVRVTALFKRKEGVSKEDFEKYWLTEFPKAFTSLEVVKGKTIIYEQGQVNEQVHDVLGKAGLPVAPYDAQAVIEGTSFEDLRDIFTSEEYRTVIGGQAKQYFERGGLIFASNVCTLADLRI